MNKIGKIREKIAGLLVGNCFGESQYSKGYCAGVIAALTVMDSARSRFDVDVVIDKRTGEPVELPTITAHPPTNDTH